MDASLSLEDDIAQIFLICFGICSDFIFLTCTCFRGFSKSDQQQIHSHARIYLQSWQHSFPIVLFSLYTYRRLLHLFILPLLSVLQVLCDSLSNRRLKIDKLEPEKLSRFAVVEHIFIAFCVWLTRRKMQLGKVFTYNVQTGL